MDLSVVIPVFNNEKTLVELVSLIRHSLDHLDLEYETILVDDCSQDLSSMIMKSLDGEFQQVHIISNQENIGQHKSILKGFQLAKGDYLCTLDADLQDDPAYIVSMVNIIGTNHDAVFLKRIGKYQSSGKMLTSYFYKSMVSHLTGLHSSAGSFFICKRSIFEIMKTFKIKYPYVSMMVAMLSTSIGYIAGERNRRKEDAGHYNFYKRIVVAFNGLHCILQVKSQKK